MFRSSAQYLKFEPDDGLHVLARGRLSVYEPKGEYQLVAEQLEPHGVGARQLAFDQLRRKLEKEERNARQNLERQKERELSKIAEKSLVASIANGGGLSYVLAVGSSELSEVVSHDR